MRPEQRTGTGSQAPERQRVAGPRRRAPQASSNDEIAHLFRDLRRVLDLSLPELARRAGTRIDVIEALERGSFSALPPWPETARTVTQLTGLAGIDARPVLAIMRHEIWQASADGAAVKQKVSRRAATLSDVPAAVAAAIAPVLESLKARVVPPSFSRFTAAALPEAAGASQTRLGRLLNRRNGLLAVVAIPLLLAAGLSEAGYFRASAGGSPPTLGGLYRSLEDAWLRWQAPEREGLKWIDVDDPRARKGDKLQSAGG